MTDLISRIYQDYNDYEFVCSKLKIDSLDIKEDFYKHSKKLSKQKRYLKYIKEKSYRDCHLP